MNIILQERATRNKKESCVTTAVQAPVEARVGSATLRVRIFRSFAAARMNLVFPNRFRININVCHDKNKLHVNYTKVDGPELDKIMCSS